MTNLKIGLCGTGNVGSAFIESIVSSESLINQNYGLNISISLIGARKGKVSGVSDISVITDIQEVAKSDDVDVVVELIGGVEDAYKLAISALKNKKHVVTANKALIAKYGDQLSKIAEKNKVPLYVVYNLDVGYLGGGLRQHKFKLDGLKVLETNWVAIERSKIFVSIAIPKLK